MESEKYYIKISPGVLKDDIISETYDGSTFGVYTGMTQLLSGGTNGDSILTGLTIPVLFKDSFNEGGIFSLKDQTFFLSPDEETKLEQLKSLTPSDKNDSFPSDLKKTIENTTFIVEV